MSELARFAQDGNADQCFAIIEDQHFENPILQEMNFKYTNGIFDDERFCQAINEYIQF